MSKGEKITLTLMFLVGVALAYVLLDLALQHTGEQPKIELRTSLEKDITQKI